MTTQPSSSRPGTHSVSIFDGYGVPKRYSEDAISTPIENAWQQVRRTFGTLGQRLLTTATGASGPIVRQRRDRHGQSYYTIYDPVSRRRTVCASETEVRLWLEQRYYH